MKVLELRERLTILVKAALEKKANKLVVLDVRGLTSYTDYIVICSGDSSRQVQAIAENVETVLKRDRILPLGIEGMRECNWILMDYNDIVFHVFSEPVRIFYDLEGIYPDAPRFEAISEDTTIEEMERMLFAT